MENVGDITFDTYDGGQYPSTLQLGGWLLQVIRDDGTVVGSLTIAFDGTIVPVGSPGAMAVHGGTVKCQVLTTDNYIGRVARQDAQGNEVPGAADVSAPVHLEAMQMVAITLPRGVNLVLR